MNEEKESFKDRAADKMKAAMSTWSALFSMLLFISGWIFLVDIGIAIDNKQLTILNLVLSSLAGLQCFILLIAGRRGEVMMEKIINHILTETDEIDALLKKNVDLTAEIHRFISEHKEGDKREH
jgi:uncharacterized membrane protein